MSPEIFTSNSPSARSVNPKNYLFERRAQNLVHFCKKAVQKALS